MIISKKNVVAAVAIALVFAFFASTFLAAVAQIGSCFTGFRKGTIWSDGEWHHYVDFAVNTNAEDGRWHIVSAPIALNLVV